MPNISLPGDAPRWRGETGNEWAGTSLVFRLRPADGKTQLELTHENWASETP